MATATKIVLGVLALVALWLWLRSSQGGSIGYVAPSGGVASDSLPADTLPPGNDAAIAAVAPLAATDPALAAASDLGGGMWQGFGATLGISPVVPALVNAWGGVDAKVADMTKADQSLYPGFYRTGDGGWYNPSTGESYSPGSSPVATPVVDLSSLPTFDLPDTPLPMGSGDRLPYDPNQVIY